MKVRMHEKAKKKTAEKYSVQQLLEKVTLTRYPQQRRTITGILLKCIVFNSNHQLHVSYIT